MTEVPANQASGDRSNGFHCGVFLRLLYVVDLANPRNSNNPGIIGSKRNRLLTTRHGLLHAGPFLTPACPMLPVCLGFTPFLGLE